MIGIGVIGLGYWGPNLVRNFAKTDGCRLVAAADRDPVQLGKVGRAHPSVALLGDSAELIARDDVDAVVVVTPLSTHFEVGKAALAAGKHVLMEKPLTETVAQSEELIAIAESSGLVLMVDHTFVYTGAVRRMREVIESGELGDIYYYDSVRINLGPFRTDASVLWDLGPHDFSIMSYAVGKNPVRLSAVGYQPIPSSDWKVESLAYVNVWFSDDTMAHFNLNWLSPVKIRRTLIGGSRKMVVYDALDVDNQVKIYDKGVEVQSNTELYSSILEYRSGDMVVPKVDLTEPLEVACRHFVDCVRDGTRPVTDGNAGLDVVRLLEASQKSMEDMGRIVDL